jgi:hypothetical protein
MLNYQLINEKLNWVIIIIVIIIIIENVMDFYLTVDPYR